MQKILVALSVLLTFSFCTLRAQENSPYTRYGLGDVNTGAISSQLGMGGLYSAVSSPQYVNYQNPAALGKLFFANFQVDAIGSARWEKSKDSSTAGFANGAPRSLILGFPVKKIFNKKKDRKETIWGMAFGIQAASNTSYNICRETLFNYNNTSSSIAQQQTGNGGTYRFFMGHGFKIKLNNFNSIYLGARLEYQFGNIIKSNLALFPDSFNAFSTRQKVYNNVSGFIPGAGFQYELHNGKSTFTLGGNITLPSNTTITQYSQWERFVGTGSIRDTVSPQTNIGTMHTPLMYALGFTWAFTNKDSSTRIADLNKWMVGVQFEAARWQDYRFLGSPDSLSGSWKASIGAEYRPDYAAIDNYWARVRYRFGGYMAQLPLVLNNTPTKSYAITLGLGLPISPKSSFISEINLGLELGTLGTTNNGLLREDFLKLHIGFTFNDNRWFIPRKFD